MRITDVVDHLQRSLDFHAARHNVLASNLAHVDTPGFAPKDLARTDFESTLSATMTATDDKHIGAHAPPPGKVVTDQSGEGVKLDKEAVKLASNNLRYDVVAGLVSSHLAMLNFAISDGSKG